MAARNRAAGRTDDPSTAPAPHRATVLRFLTAALAGGAVLLLWGGSAGARAADGPPLTPVMDLVDQVTTTATGTAPVGTTVQGVVTTIDPVIAPVTAPVTDAVAPITDPVIGTVADVTDGVVGSISRPPTPGSPEVPGTPTPGLPPILPPGTETGPELPPLVPPTDATPSPTDGSTASGSTIDESAAPLLASTDDGHGGALHATSAAEDRETGGPDGARAAMTADPAADRTAPGTEAHARDGRHHPSAPSLPAAPAPAPAPCSGGAPSGGSAGEPVRGVAAGDATADLRHGAGATIDVPTSTDPARAPSAGPEVSPD